MHPLAGTWTANLAKSQRHANHQFRSATMSFEIAGQAVSLTYSGVNASGNREASTQTLQADGTARAVPQAPGIVAMTTLGARRLEMLGKKDQTVIGRSTYEVSEDGRTMTATVSGVDAGGKPFDQVIVFDREQAP